MMDPDQAEKRGLGAGRGCTIAFLGYFLVGVTVLLGLLITRLFK